MSFASALNKKLFFLTALIAVVASPILHADTQRFYDLLLEGQNPAFQVHRRASQDQLQALNVHPAVSSSRIDPACQCLSWLAINPSMSPLYSESELAEAATQAILEHLGLNIGEADLRPAINFDISPNSQLRILSFDRLYQGIEVEDARIQVVFTRRPQGYLLRELVNRSFGNISLPASNSDAISREEIQAITGMPFISTLSDEPRILATLGADGTYQFSHSRKVEFSGPMGDHFTVFVGQGLEPLRAFRHQWHAEHTLQAQVPERSPIFQNNARYPLSFVRVDNERADAAGKIDTEANTVTVALDSRYARVALDSARNTPYQFNVTLDESGTTTVTGADANLSALSVYSHVALIHEFVRRFLTPEQAPILANPINVFVDIRDTCNAFFQPQNFSINFFLAGNNCENTSLISDVVYHEWGHALDFVTGTRPGIPDGAFSEGIGDILSMFITFSNNMAPGFFQGNQQGIRNLDNNVTHPPANAAERQPHNQGRIIGGSFWSLQQNLMAVMGREAGNDYLAKIFLEHLLTTDFYVDSYAALLRLDSNNVDPSVRSPNFCKINQAFARHNLSEAANCIDLDPGLMVQILDDDNNGTIQIAASSFGASKIVVCEGDSDNCDADSDGYLAFSPLDQDHSKLIFRATGSIDVQAGQTISIYSFNSRDEIVGKKTIQFDIETEES